MLLRKSLYGDLFGDLRQIALKTTTVWLVFALVSLLLTCPAMAEESIVAQVNKSSISQQALQDAVQLALMQNTSQSHNDHLQEVVLDDLIVTEAMYQAAQKDQLSQKDDVKRALQAMQKKLLAEAWLVEQLAKEPITDEQIQREYQRQVQLAKSGKNAHEYKARHIVLSDEAEAQQLIKRLKTGESFDLLAKTYSLDKHSATKGGQLNWMMPDQFISPLGDVLITLPKDQVYPTPIKTQLGWHIIKLDSVRDIVIPELSMIKSALLRNMVEERKANIIDQLMKKTQVNIVAPSSQPSP